MDLRSSYFIRSSTEGNMDRVEAAYRTVHATKTNDTVTTENEDVDSIYENRSADDESDVKIKRDYTSDMTNVFGIVVCDEAHKIKTDSSKTFASISQLKSQKTILLTDTPMLNKPLDLFALLKAFWQDTWILMRRMGARHPSRSTRITEPPTHRPTRWVGRPFISGLGF